MKESETMVTIEIVNDSLPIFKKNIFRLGLILILFIVTMLTDTNVRMIFKVADPRLLAWMALLCLFALYIIIREYQQIIMDTGVVEDLEADKQRINLAMARIPLDIAQKNSFFVKHFARLCLAKEISSFQQQTLTNEYFQGNVYLNLSSTILSLLGFAGTIMGLSKALAQVSVGDNVLQGIAYAFGTTLLGIYGLVIIYSLNENLKIQKKRLFYLYLDIISSIIKERRHNHV